MEDVSRSELRFHCGVLRREQRSVAGWFQVAALRD